MQPKNYEILGVYEPAVKENPARRPPKIYNLEESVVAYKRVLIDTYLFSSDFSKVYVLREKDSRAPTGGAGGNNPFGKVFGSGSPGLNSPPSRAPSSALMQKNRNRLGNVGGAGSLQGLQSSDLEYDGKFIPVADWNPQELTARQPRPLRVAVIGGSFPYRRQLEEFKKQLRLPDIASVLNETLPDKEKESKSFEFLGVEVQRVEVDADGKNLGEWSDLPLAETYQLWLKSTFWPFQAEDPKYNYNLIKFDGLVLPLLREFHANKKVDPTMRTPGMMPPGMPRLPTCAEPTLQPRTPQNRIIRISSPNCRKFRTR